MMAVTLRSLLFGSALLSQAVSAAFVPRQGPTTDGASGCPHRQFDYVIVGGGTAGAVVAARLSEDPSVTVAVIEAGTWPEYVHGNWTQVPLYAGNFYTINDPMMWPFVTTPQTGLKGSVVPYFRPKAFGGCSDINSMAFGHTSIGAHQAIADAVGDQSYTYNNMLKYYHKTMNFTPYNYSSTRFANATPMYDPADTVTGGGLGVSYPAYAQAWSTWVAKGMDAIGLKRVNAFINGNLLGHSFHQNTIFHSNGFRSSSEAAYLRPASGRRNLFLFDYSLATKIVFDNQNTATGVVINGTCTISAKREVILSAGVFQSPQLLMVSGVGPAPLLKSLNISVVADRPGVGQNLREHIVSFMSYQVNVVTASQLENPTYLAQAISDFNNHATGMLTSVGGDYMAMEKIPADLRANWSSVTTSALNKLPSDWPEIAYAILPNGIPPQYAPPSVPIVPGANYAAGVFVLFAPQSIGNVSIASADMRQPPIINPALLTHPADVDVMVAGFKRLRQALRSDAMAPVLIGPEVVPGNATQTDEQIIDFLRSTVNPFQHASSSNKMGVSSDPTAVVDSRGLVFGVKKLRIVDASAFPFLPPGPAPQIQVYSHAEKFADIIKNSYW